ncbi:hypothetical protein D3C80_420180 [compost metagenome]
MATALGKFGNSPLKCQPWARNRFLKIFRLKQLPRAGTRSGKVGKYLSIVFFFFLTKLYRILNMLSFCKIRFIVKM